MKKVFALLMAFAVMAQTFAAVSVTVPPKKASEVFIPIGNSGQKISLEALAQIKVKDFEKLTGRDMKFTQKVTFKLAQKELRKNISADGTISSKKLNKFFNKVDGTEGFHLGGFALGFLLGLIGVLIAYLLNDDKKSNRVKWAWIGLGVVVVLYLLAILA
ncbi:MAG: hypothetical protein ACO1NX_00515 [Chitinophagaceae bacterium]